MLDRFDVTRADVEYAMHLADEAVKEQAVLLLLIALTIARTNPRLAGVLIVLTVCVGMWAVDSDGFDPDTGSTGA